MMSEVEVDGSLSLHDEEDGSSTAESKLSSGQDDSAESRTKVRHALASDETRAVTCSKLLMLFVLLGVAAAATTIVFKYTTRQEEEDFEVRVS
jgi:heme/copper-type cytochrome/quinol oxidase subunit 2